MGVVVVMEGGMPRLIVLCSGWVLTVCSAQVHERDRLLSSRDF